MKTPVGLCSLQVLPLHPVFVNIIPSGFRSTPTREDPMLKTDLIHPEILGILATAGHHAKILIADANYPATTKLGPNADVVYLNLAPGILSVAQVLKTILAVHPVEEAVIMGPLREDPAIAGYAPDWEPPVWEDYRAVFAASDQDQEMKVIDKWAYYEYVETPDHILTIQTGEQEMYANICLATGVRKS